MPCIKCENGKYKHGETGSCEYDTLEECKKANPDYYEEKEPTRIVELVIEDDAEALAIDAISLVSNPAIEQNFVYMNKRKNNLTFAKIEEEKREIISPALIPDKHIFRFDPNTGAEYYVYFSKSTVKQAAYLYLEHNNHHKATYEHKDRVAGVLTVESWIVEDPKIDKSRLYGYKNIPVGTWFVKMKIENSKLWEEVKSGSVRGLSIEGYFIDKMQKMQKMKKENKPTDADILSALNELFKEGKLNKLSKSQKINLGLSDDLKKLSESAEDIAKNIDKDSSSLSKLYRKVADLADDFNSLNDKRKNEIKEGKAVSKQINNLVKETQGLSRDLGIAARDIPGFSEAVSISENLRAATNDIQKYSKIEV
tara:strand:+ start:372 stop:1472 length:1101 start_codon:yes stop_codon:yes gene_type:complete